jgi:hypothetical protein
MTTGCTFRITFKWTINASSMTGIPTDGPYAGSTNYMEKSICADTPETALSIFRDWYIKERHAAVYQYKKDYPNEEELPEHFFRYWPELIQVQSIIQEGTIIV